MHAQQIPGGATLPIPIHPSLPNSSNGPSAGPPPQLGMLSKQELMLHSRPDDNKGPNDENRHVSLAVSILVELELI